MRRASLTGSAGASPAASAHPSEAVTPNNYFCMIRPDALGEKPTCGDRNCRFGGSLEHQPALQVGLCWPERQPGGITHWQFAYLGIEDAERGGAQRHCHAE